MLTLMAVHAHPDDEASTTGGILAKYSAEGIRTVLVTCTDGALGDSAETKAGEDGHGEGHDHDAVVELRTRELRDSCEVLGITHLELLGYRDSGMMGWPTNDAPGSFWGTPVEEAARPLIALIEKYQPELNTQHKDKNRLAVILRRGLFANEPAPGNSLREYFSREVRRQP